MFTDATIGFEMSGSDALFVFSHVPSRSTSLFILCNFTLWKHKIHKYLQFTTNSFYHPLLYALAMFPINVFLCVCSTSVISKCTTRINVRVPRRNIVPVNLWRNNGVNRLKLNVYFSNTTRRYFYYCWGRFAGMIFNSNRAHSKPAFYN